MELVETKIDNERQHQYEAYHHEAIYYTALKDGVISDISNF